MYACVCALNPLTLTLAGQGTIWVRCSSVFPSRHVYSVVTGKREGNVCGYRMEVNHSNCNLYRASSYVNYNGVRRSSLPTATMRSYARQDSRDLRALWDHTAFGCIANYFVFLFRPFSCFSSMAIILLELKLFFRYPRSPTYFHEK